MSSGSAAGQPVEVPDTTLGLVNTAIGLATDLEVSTGALADGISGPIPVTEPNKAPQQLQVSDLNSQLRLLVKSLKNATFDFRRARNGIGA